MQALLKRFVAWAGVPVVVDLCAQVVVLVASVVLLGALPPSRPYVALAILFIAYRWVGMGWDLLPFNHEQYRARVCQLADQRMARCRAVWCGDTAVETEMEMEERQQTETARAAVSVATVQALLQASQQRLYTPEVSATEKESPPQRMILPGDAAGNMLPSPMSVSRQGETQAAQSHPPQAVLQQLPHGEAQCDDASDARLELSCGSGQPMRLQRVHFARRPSQLSQSADGSESCVDWGNHEPTQLGSASLPPLMRRRRSQQMFLRPVTPPAQWRAGAAAESPRGPCESLSESAVCSVPVRELAASAVSTGRAAEAAANVPYGGHASLANSASDWGSRIRVLSCSVTSPHRPSRKKLPQEPPHGQPAAAAEEARAAMRVPAHEPF